MPESNSHPTIRYDQKSSQPRTSDAESESIHVLLDFNIDLTLLRKQKRALIGVYEGTTVTYEQEETAEGILNLIDFIQDSIVKQGLATEEKVFPQLPQLFEE